MADEIKTCCGIVYPECGAMVTYPGYDGAEVIYFFTFCFISDKDE